VDCVDTLELVSPQPLPRATLGGFTLVQEMAVGGMATVYLGHRQGPTGLTQVAAIKVMFPRLVKDAEYVEMFFDEARLTSSIRHPNVCQVLDYGVEDGFHYLATEYVLGETWSDLVDMLHQTAEGRAAAPGLLSYIAAQVCEGLHGVHETRDERGKHLAIVHRDVSPQNVMICYDGTVRVLDFGIASAAERLHETRNGVLKGHVAYMAPEQMEIRVVDRRCDIWPLGVMLWEGATGRRLFKRENSRARGGPLPGPLMSVIERCVVRDPNARFATARDLGTELSTLRLGPTAVTSTQVALWMRRLFAERFEQKRTGLRRALSPDTEITDVSQSAVRLAFSGASVSDAPAWGAVPAMASTYLSVSSPARNTSIPPRVGSASAPRPTRYRALVALVAFIAIVGGLSVGLRSSSDGAPASEQQPLVELVPLTTQVVKPLEVARAHASPAGILDVRASGRQVRVECEGRDLGMTPLRVELAPGRHLLRILPGAGAAVTEAPVVIESGEHYVMDIEPSTQHAP